LDTSSQDTLEAQVTSARQWYGDWIVETFKQFLIWPLSQFISRSYCSVSTGGLGKKVMCPL